MCDYRENVLSNVSERLLDDGFSPEDVAKIKNSIVLALNNYELSPRCTDIVVRDDSNDRLIKIYLGTILTEGKSQKTAKNYQRLLKRFISDVGKKFTEVDTFDVRVWLASEQQRISLSTVETERAYISAFYSFLVSEEMIQVNPMARIKPIKFADPIKTEFSDVELDALRNAHDSLRSRAEMELMLSSGVRVEELTNLNRNDIDFNTMEVKVRAGKGNKSRTTFMNDVCKYHLLQYMNDRHDNLPELFITRNAERVTTATVSNDMKRIAEKAKVENVHPHRFRRTFATTLHKRGMDLASIQKLMGHSNPDTTIKYINISESRIKTAYESCV